MGAIYLIRHGQASFGRPDYDRLSRQGYRQAARLGEVLAERLEHVDAVVCGAMRRHRETAETCLRAFARPPAIREDPGFNEFDHYDVITRYRPAYANRLVLMADMAKGLNPRRRFQAVFNEATARWLSGRYDSEYAESWPAFRGRCLHALEAILAALGASKTALIFTSAGPITAICQDLLQVPDEHAFRINVTLTNCGVTKLIYSPRGRYLSTLNDHGHFEGAWLKLMSYR